MAVHGKAVGWGGPGAVRRPLRIWPGRAWVAAHGLAALWLAALWLAGAWLLGSMVGCDDAPPDLGALDAAPTDAAADRGPLDAGGPPVGAACPDGRCGAGSCVAGYCARPCLDDVDCPEPDLVCVAAGTERRCAPACAGPSDCPAGEICATDGPGRGACAQPGAAPAGGPCAGDLDCQSLYCAGGVCLAACPAGASCPAGEACLALHTQAVCAGAGEGGPEAPCALGADCASGVCRGGRCSATCDATAAPTDCAHDRTCRAYAELALCERLCARAADCGEGAACQLTAGVPQCVLRGTRLAGEACGADTECAALLCVGGACARACAVDGACPAGLACVTDLLGGLCRPAGGARAGDPCAQALDCASGLCVGGVCTAACPAGQCPAGQLCAPFLTGDFCLQACAESADCAAAAFCDASLAAAPACFWRGVAVEGEACARHRDCASGRCAGGRCRAECPDGQCPAGEACVALADGVAPACVPDPRPAGAACAGGTCAEGLDCVAGTCQPPCAEGCPEGAVCAAGRCHPACRDADDCRPGRRCIHLDGPAPHCVDPGPVATRGACVASAECAQGACLGGRCRAPCGACAAEEVCAPFAGGGLCLPRGPGAPGAACDTLADCAGAPCVAGRCAPPCAANPCPADARCTDSASGQVCRVFCNPLDSLEVVASACGEEARCQPLAGVTDPARAVRPTPPAPVAEAGRCAAPGGAPLGGLCDDRAPCDAPAVCLRRGADAGTCRVPCAFDAHCALGETCARDHAGQLGGCVPAGAAPLQADCAADADCAQGWCEAGRCARACAPTGSLVDPAGPTLCDQPTTPGARCVDVDRQPFAPRRRCAAPCDLTAPTCPPGRACRLDAAAEGACW